MIFSCDQKQQVNIIGLKSEPMFPLPVCGTGKAGLCPWQPQVVATESIKKWVSHTINDQFSPGITNDNSLNLNLLRDNSEYHLQWDWLPSSPRGSQHCFL